MHWHLKSVQPLSSSILHAIFHEGHNDCGRLIFIYNLLEMKMENEISI